MRRTGYHVSSTLMRLNSNLCEQRFFSVPVFESDFLGFWSLDEVVGDLRIHVRACVRMYVRHAVAPKPFITFF